MSLTIVVAPILICIQSTPQDCDINQSRWAIDEYSEHWYKDSDLDLIHNTRMEWTKKKNIYSITSCMKEETTVEINNLKKQGTDN